MSCMEIMYQHPAYAPYFPAAAGPPAAPGSASAAAHYGSGRGAGVGGGVGGGPSTMEQLKKFGLHGSKLPEEPCSPFSLRGVPPPGSLSSRAAAASSVQQQQAPGASITPKREQEAADSGGGGRAGEPGAPPTNTQYVSSTCVILTYFSGDTADTVDEHFSRALSGPGYAGGGGKSPPQQQQAATTAAPPDNSASASSSSASTQHWNKDHVSPMSSRNFPASFWNSHYQAPVLSTGSHTGAGLVGSGLGGPADLTAAFSDPYSHMTSSSLHHAAASLHQQSHMDPWGRHYAGLAAACSSSAQAPQYPSHPAASLQDFSYSSAAMHASSRFNAYSSLLQPHSTSRLSAAGQCADPLSKHTMAGDTWGAGSSHRYHAGGDPLHPSASLGSSPGHHDSLHSAAAAAASITGGIDTGALQSASTTKDMYWF